MLLKFVHSETNGFSPGIRVASYLTTNLRLHTEIERWISLNIEKTLYIQCCHIYT